MNSVNCPKCNKPISAPRTICEECNDLELRINAPRYFSKPLLNAEVNWSPYKAENTVDRWKQKGE